MNSVLAQIYGTGFEKQASYNDELDLNQISGAQLLELLQAEEQEKNASEGFDISELSGRELLELYAEAEEQEAAEGEYAVIEKMASDGSLDYFDAAGRIQAHAYWDEMNKFASEEDEVYDIDLDAISGAELEELFEAGFEILGDDGFEKEARMAGPSRFTQSTYGHRARQAGSDVLSALRSAATGGKIRAGHAQSRAGRAAAADAEKAREGAVAISKRQKARSVSGRQTRIGRRAERLAGSRAKTRDAALSDAELGRKLRNRGILETGALYGGLGAAGAGAAGTAALGTAGAAGLGTAAYMRHKKKGPWAKGGRFNR